MNPSLSQQLAALERLTTTQMVQRYQDLFGQAIHTRNRQYLFRKLAWRIQALAQGDLSERARERAAELAVDADVRVMPPKVLSSPTRVVPGPRAAAQAAPSDPRLPSPGTSLVREYRGRHIEVLVQPDGFEFDGNRYKSLTGVAKVITGTHVNGYRFFNLEGN